MPMTASTSFAGAALPSAARRRGIAPGPGPARVAPGPARRRATVARPTAALEQDLAGETVVVVGLGASGRAAAKLALARGATVIGVDSKTTTAPLESDPELMSKRVSTQLGPHDRATLLNADRLVLSPGVPPKQPDLAAALAAGVPAVSECAFAYEALPAGMPLAAVTGTNGKSTTTTFAGQLLAACGRRPFVGGNLGTPLSVAARLLGSNPSVYDSVVLEVSSYQMEFPGALRPLAAVLLNLTPDHIERHGSMEAYGATKCRLFARMGPEGIVGIPSGDPLIARLAEEAGGAARRAWLGEQELPGAANDHAGHSVRLRLPAAKGTRPPSWPSEFVGVPGSGAVSAGSEPELYDLSALIAEGKHNEQNAAAALLLARGLNLPPAALQAAIGRLRPPPHRMEVVGEFRGLQYVDDSKATNVESAMAGISGLRRAAVVLLGGQAKEGVAAGGGLGFSQLVPLLTRHRAVLCFGKDGPRIAAELRAAGYAGALQEAAGGMAEAVAAAPGLAKPGDAVLLSPACASFDQFDNYEHRGRVFAALARGESWAQCYEAARRAPEA